MNAFYINLELPKIENYARKHGFQGPRWKQAVLDDLLFDNHIRVEESFDPRDTSKTVWHCMGRKASLSCVQDARKEDALFCIGLVKGPDVGGPPETSALHRIPGPWRVHTFGRRPKPPLSAEEHIRKCIGTHTPPRGGFRNSPFDVLSAMKIPNLTGDRRTPPAPPHERDRAGDPAPKEAAPDSGPHPIASDDAPRVEEDTARTTGAEALAAEDEPATLPPESSPPVTAPPSEPSPPPEPLPSSEVASGDEPPPPATCTPVATVPEEPGAATPIRLSAEEARFEDYENWDRLARELVGRAHPSTRAFLGTADPVGARRRRISLLEAEIARLEDELGAVPDEEAILQADDLHRDLADLARRVVPQPPPRVDVQDLERLEAILRAFEDDLPRFLPPWVCGLDLAREDAIRNILSDPQAQALLAEALRWVQRTFAGAAPESLAGLPEPGHGHGYGQALHTPPAVHLRIRAGNPGAGGHART